MTSKDMRVNARLDRDRASKFNYIRQRTNQGGEIGLVIGNKPQSRNFGLNRCLSGFHSFQPKFFNPNFNLNIVAVLITV
jgi:hypothetical protein